ncbi:MAG TPA: AmmeMemoRadiSam system radical SAM enzyme [Bacteroidales bacterium]|nr:AmmeMemoRadiSam system radical SAM enzyme [Bacteroidales bacterium]
MKKRTFIKTSLAGLGGMFVSDHLGAESTGRPAEDLWKWSRESVYATETPRGIRCLICPNECTLKPGELSDCHNRINYKGKLYTIAYGNPCSIHIDPVEKKPLNHFLPGSTTFSIATAGCNLACLNCQNWQISQTSPKETRNYDLMPDKVVQQAVKNNCKSIAYTYSEPITFYEYVRDTSSAARPAGIRNILVSNGYIKEEPLRELCKYIDAANIDLKAYSEDIYQKLTGGNLKTILATLEIMKEEGVWLEITNLVIPTWTDDMSMISKMCDWLANHGFSDTPLHFSRFMPLHKLTRLPATPGDVLHRARETAMQSGLKYVYIGNIPGLDESDTYCPSCGEKIIERTGYQVMRMEISQGHCQHCNAEIAGVWR